MKMQVIDGRLVRANVQESARDYSNYQRIANNITTRWVRQAQSPFDITLPSNTKNPIHDSNTFLADEIYALAIEYIYSNGDVSPAFHIPGREATSSDTQLLTVGTDIPVENVAHLELTSGNTIPRWQYENTATGVLSGDLGYFETDTLYPDTVDCNGNYIYGDLAKTPIRHHRIPCRSKIPTYFNSNGEPKINRFGIEFDNITYPDSDIVGHRFLVAKKTNSDKTVIDTGFVFGAEPYDNENYIFKRLSINYYYYMEWRAC
jgi:hypothetical protein